MKNKDSTLFSIILCSFIMIILLPAIGTAQQSEPNAKGIRLTVINDPSNSVVITWYTTSKASIPRVEYDSSPLLENAVQEIATEKVVDGTYIYSVELTELKPQTTYYYQVMESSEIFDFSTAPPRDIEHVEFIVLGDTQKVEQPTVTLTENALAKWGDQIDFLIHLGDIVDNGISQNWYNKYFTELDHLHPYYQTYFTEGNHERGVLTKMYDNLPLPSNGMNSRYYSFDWGPTSWLSLNDNGWEILPHQRMPMHWLESELTQFDNDKHTLWKFAYMHQPFWNTKPGRADKYELIPTWGNSFDSHGVDMVFFGHNHYYERSYPMSSSGEIDTSETTHFKDPEYPIYLTVNSDRKMYSINDDCDVGEVGCDPNKLPSGKDYVYYHNMTSGVCHFEIDVDMSSGTTELSLETWALPLSSEYEIITTGAWSKIDDLTITKDIPEKYIDSTYEAPTTISYQRSSESVYYIMYLAIPGVLFIVLNFKSFQNYLPYKKQAIKKKFSETHETRLGTKPIIQSIIMLCIFIILIMVFTSILIALDVMELYISIPLGIILSILIMVGLNQIVYGKQKAMNTVVHFFSLLLMVGIIALLYFSYTWMFYLIFLNIIYIGIAVVLSYGAHRLSKTIEPSKISGQDSFYLGGILIAISTLFLVFSLFTLIGLI